MRLDEAARLYLGIPYRHQGRDPMLGIDCVGLVVSALQLAGREVVDVTNYAADPHDGLLEKHLQDAFGATVYPWQPGDIASLRFFGAVRHVAIIGENKDGLTLIHTARNLGRVVEHGINERWRKRIAGVYRA